MTVDLAKLAERILTTPYRYAKERCPVCRGDGAVALQFGETETERVCRMCGGTGHVLVEREIA